MFQLGSTIFRGREATMWFLILTVIVFNVVFWVMPKKLTSIEIFSTCMFAMVFQQLVDYALDIQLDLYGYFTKGTQWGYLIAIVGIYPAVNAIFLNFYQFMKTIAQKVWYIFGCSVFAVLYEWLADKSGYFYHDEWKLWHSAIVYPFLFLILVYALKYVRTIIDRQYKKSP